MRRLPPIVLACLLVPALGAPLAAPVAAAGSFSEAAPLWIGGSLSNPPGYWSQSQYCFAGDVNTIEFRCGWEFNLDGIPFGSIITSATLRVTRTSGDCSANNCPVLLHWFDGNGGADLSDVVAGSSVSYSWTPSDNSPHSFNVLDQIRDFYARGRAWAGFNLRATGNYGLYQFFDPASISLEVSYGQAVTVLVEPFFNGGTGRISTTPSGIKCPDLCGRDFADGTKLTLTAMPDAGSAISEWRTGPCAHSTKLTCSFDVPTSDVTVAVTFVAAPKPTPTPARTSPPTQPPSPHPTATSIAAGSVAPSAAATAPEASPGSRVSADATAAASGDGTASPSVTDASSGATAGATASGPPDVTAVPGPGPVSSSDTGVPLPIVVLLLVLVIAIGSGGFWLGTRRRKPGAD